MSKLGDSGTVKKVVTPIEDLPRRGRAICAGYVAAVTIAPLGNSPQYTAILTDRETYRSENPDIPHRVRLVWLGRRTVPGIVAGTKLKVEGMVAMRDGLPTIFNPRYEIIRLQES